jgi:hypothetical protein
MRAIGFVKFFKDLIKKEIKKSINVFIYTASAVAFVTPLIFLQKGVVYNSIQFSQYFLLLSGFVAAVSMGKIIKKLKNKFAKIFITFMVILLMVPTTLGLLWQFYSNKPLAKVSAVELSALSYLRTTNQDSIILTVSYNQYNAGKDGIPPVPIYDWSDTGYIPALSGRRTLISDAEQIDIMGYDAKSLLAAREEAFNDKTGSSLTAFVRNYGINYIYLNKDEDAGINYKKLNLEKVFSNTEVDVYKVNKQ